MPISLKNRRLPEPVLTAWTSTLSWLTGAFPRPPTFCPVLGDTLGVFSITWFPFLVSTSVKLPNKPGLFDRSLLKHWPLSFHVSRNVFAAAHPATHLKVDFYLTLLIYAHILCARLIKTGACLLFLCWTEYFSTSSSGFKWVFVEMQWTVSILPAAESYLNDLCSY